MDLNNFDYGATKKVEGPLAIRRLLILLVYTVYTVALALIVFVWLRIVPVFALWPFGLLILHLLLWKYTQIDYIYHIEAGMLTLNRRYGNKKLHEIVSFRLKEAELIAPRCESEEKIAEFAPEIVYDATPSKDTVDVFVMLFRNKEGKRCAMYVEVSEASLKALHYYNSSVKMVKTLK